ncbi:MAG TPA: TetR/AcrR family transcriptional regulator [Candidatus Aquabacterium excrementipullorum]|nr:TetR/AcrR family transcriptional regulator [Candidatus Aquabacterium excrementipullorum]
MTTPNQSTAPVSSEDKAATPPASSTPYHHGNLRAALIEVGLQALRDKPAHELSLRDLARQVGVSANAAYRHFADKEALLMALAAEGFRRFTQAQVQAAIAGDTPLTMFKSAGQAYVRFARDNAALFQLMFGRFPAKERSPELVETSEASFSGLIGLAALHAGLPQDHPAVRIRALTAWSFVHGLSHLVLDGQLDKFGDDIDTLVDVLIDQMGAAALPAMSAEA